MFLAAPLLCGAGHRDWRLITIAHEAGDFTELRAGLGNNVVIKASRKDQRPFLDGTVIARLAWRYESSPANNAVFDRGAVAMRPVIRAAHHADQTP